MFDLSAYQKMVVREEKEINKKIGKCYADFDFQLYSSLTRNYYQNSTTNHHGAFRFWI
uniref:Uncharacterized protein n=1 Tax=Lepeophtheirus salmonis TaxID=72036 RepID=A0A0K2TR94_LEPSM